MKKTTILFLLASFTISLQAQKGISMAVQYHTQRNVFKDNSTSNKDLGSGIGIGVNISKTIAKIPFAIQPRFVYISQRVSTSGISNLKTSYIQLPVSINILALTKKYFDDLNDQNKAFVFGLNVGLYGTVAIGGNFKNTSSTQKMQYGEGSTDNRARSDYGLHTEANFGSKGSGFKGYVQVQRGFNNVIPNARITNGASRKLNAINVGIAFKIKEKLFRK